MTKITVSQENLPIIVFDSDDWKGDDECDAVAEEIIKFIKESKFDFFLIQNNAYSFGDTETSPLIMVNREDCGGLSGTLETYIKDIVLDLLPEYDDDTE